MGCDAEMNFNRLLFSAGACFFFLYISFFLLRKENVKSDIFLASSSSLNEEEKVVKGVHFIDVGDVVDITYSEGNINQIATISLNEE